MPYGAEYRVVADTDILVKRIKLRSTMTSPNVSLTALLASLIFTTGCGSTPVPRAHVQQKLPVQSVERPRLPALPELDSDADISQWLPECVQTPHGCLALDEEYIAGVIQCEIAGVTNSGAALEAQAIAARTYLAAYGSRKGTSDLMNITARFQCWKKPKSERALLAATSTSGIIMLKTGLPINANYVSGTRHLSYDCQPKPPSESGYGYESWSEMRAEYQARRRARKRAGFKGTDWTEVVVTRNEGNTGHNVNRTPMHGQTKRNRGALSQRTAICLAENLGYETLDILRYFYGDDFDLSAPIPAPTD